MPQGKRCYHCDDCGACQAEEVESCYDSYENPADFSSFSGEMTILEEFYPEYQERGSDGAS